MSPDLIQTIANVATAAGVFVAAWELLQAKKQDLIDFEDEFAREYRELAQKLPIKALLGDALDDREAQKALRGFFHYVDLCNEQVFLRQNDRVSTSTWESWNRGMKSNLELPAFRAAWEEIKKRARTSFAELRRLEASNFQDDPVEWGLTHLEVDLPTPEESTPQLRRAA